VIGAAPGADRPPGAVPPGEPADAGDDDALNRDRIEREAAAVDAQFNDLSGPGPGPGAGPVPLAVNVIEENTALLSTIITILSPALPFLPGCYPPSTVAAIAAAYTAVEVKRGWNLRKLVSEEGALLMVAAPPTIAAVIAGRQHFARLAAAKEAKEAVPTPGAAAPGAAPAPDKPVKPAPYPDIADGVSLRRV